MREPTNVLRLLGATPAEADVVAGRLLAALASDPLPYHNLDHVIQTLTFANRWRHLVENYVLVELALWFHDLVYDPRRSDNEAASVALMGRWLGETSISIATIELAGGIIMATKDHRPQDELAGLVVDADLSILAAPRPRYQDYAAAIRLEYSWVAEDDYRVGRQAVLQRFMERPRLYTHDPIYLLCEQAARANITWEISRLQTR